MMGGIDWAALPIVADLYGYEDIEVLITHLVTIRDKNKE